MFRRPFIEKLEEEGWEEAIKEGGNPSQTRNRTNELFYLALSDIVLLYKKLPTKERDELFSLPNLKNFFDTIVSDDTTNGIANLEIASYLMEKSAEIFKEKFTENNKDTATIANLVNDSLDKASNICKEITYKEKLEQKGFEISDESITYLCSWNKMLNRDKYRLKDHIRKGLRFAINEFELYRKKNNVNELEGSFKDNLGKIYDFTLILHKSERYVSLRIKGNLLYANQDFPIESRNGEYLLYYKKDSFTIERADLLSNLTKKNLKSKK
jgi:hypothetical protein